MDRRLYEQMAVIEDKHWWFVSRQKIIETILLNKILIRQRKLKILDAGCGTGETLRFLSSYSKNVIGMELDHKAAELAREKSKVPIFIGKLPEDMPFPKNYFDLIVLLDVLEHIEDDQETLNILTSRLKPGGHLLITVPAFQFLWSNHDESHHHKRRYRLKEISTKLEISGLNIRYASYFNTWLFPIISMIRFGKSKFNLFSNSDDQFLPHPLINECLTKIMSSERHILRFGKLPFGVSIAALCQKPNI